MSKRRLIKNKSKKDQIVESLEGLEKDLDNLKLTLHKIR